MSMSNDKTLFIAFEGIDGSGKSTQIRRLGAALSLLRVQVCLTCEPTHENYGKMIRTAQTRLPAKRERELFTKDRKEHLETVILPALSRQQIVITDRYFYSSVAYQGVRRDAFDHEPTDAELLQLQEEIYAENVAFAPIPDILFYMELSVDEALKRMSSGRDALDPFEVRQNLEDVSKAYQHVVAKHPHCVTLDARQTPDELASQIIHVLRDRMDFSGCDAFH